MELLSPPKIHDRQSNFTQLRINGASPKSGTEPDKDDPGDNVKQHDWFTGEQREDVWKNAVCWGEKLLRAMVLDEKQARSVLQWPHVQSVWDGDLKEELKIWGYREDNEGGRLDRQCDFEEGQLIADAFQVLKIDTRSAGMGGPNRCYHFAHRDGPAVHR